LARLFVGTFLDQSEAARIGRFASVNLEKCCALQQSGPRPKFLRTEKLHMTWLFLGETAASNVEPVKNWLEAEIEPLKNKFGQSLDCTVDYTKLECWPEKRATRVLVARPEEAPETVAEIGKHLHLCFEEYRRSNPAIFAASAKEERFVEFKPHLTLIRFGNGANLSDGKLSQFIETLLPVPSRLTNMALIETRDGAYEVVSVLW
jgi:2'-5' RNA ligase